MPLKLANPNLEKSFNIILSANRLSSLILGQLSLEVDDDRDAITKRAIQLTYLTLQFLEASYSNPIEVSTILEEAQDILDLVFETQGEC